MLMPFCLLCSVLRCRFGAAQGNNGRFTSNIPSHLLTSFSANASPFQRRDSTPGSAMWLFSACASSTYLTGQVMEHTGTRMTGFALLSPIYSNGIWSPLDSLCVLNKDPQQRSAEKNWAVFSFRGCALGPAPQYSGR